MKTRIRVIEKNNGEKKYICEEDFFHWGIALFCFSTIIGIPCGIYYLIVRDWRTMHNVTLATPVATGFSEQATFQSEILAKVFIDKAILQDKEDQKRRLGNKVKSTTYIKYP